MLDFLSGVNDEDAHYSETGMHSSVGPDGWLHKEFMEMERIIAEADIETASNMSTGSNRPYTCRVANIHPAFECLDIAGASSLYTSYSQAAVDANFSPTTEATLQESNGMLEITDFMLDIDLSLRSSEITYNPSSIVNNSIFGIESKCDNGQDSTYTANGKRVGDGAINGFDLFMLTSAMFAHGPFASEVMSNVSWSALPTVGGRDDTATRCTSPFNKLEWQLRVAQNPCYVWPHSEDAYQTSLPRRLEEFTPPAFEPPQLNLVNDRINPPISTNTSGVVYYRTAADMLQSVAPRAPIGLNLPVGVVSLHKTRPRAGASTIKMIKPKLTGAIASSWNDPQLSVASGVVAPGTDMWLEDDDQEASGMGAQEASGMGELEPVWGAYSQLGIRLFRWSETPEGMWTLIHVPTVVASVEITILGAMHANSLKLRMGIPLKNTPPVSYLEERGGCAHPLSSPPTTHLPCLTTRTCEQKGVAHPYARLSLEQLRSFGARVALREAHGVLPFVKHARTKLRTDHSEQRPKHRHARRHNSRVAEDVSGEIVLWFRPDALDPEGVLA